MPTPQPASLEVLCHECGQPIPTIPAWLIGAKVKFQCNECKEKHPRPVGELDAEPRRRAATPAADEMKQAADGPKREAAGDDADIETDEAADTDDHDEFANDDVAADSDDMETE